MTCLWVKWIHILASTLLFGTGLGIAFFMWLAHLRGDARVIAATARTVVIADACFTAPAVVVQLVTGVWLTHLLGLPLDVLWVKAALMLFFVIGACWLPVLWLQVRARNLAQRAVGDGTPLPPAYHRAMRWWFWLGWPAFLSVIAIFWLMVMKPT
ncbi:MULTISPECIES: DUF2269 domain-containing protein [unclassified Pseudoxanthomonas]|uniref:DUF2269 family protein n=1 Tax=unclassified Pseudoxanthomonas TaxID=2645906 RepID=UPI0008F3C6FD|nr:MULTISPECIES: DUF2269 domain-containing protein [unclassified Pseudoxanthomonas]PPJ41366.1 DUF2269 domain-containing protein [Pseudoxanthomonas sp. KAs_5_3]SFV30499.1 Uncharacterized membrane protein [Pseudoxanthomonas sp. YR558]